MDLLTPELLLLLAGVGMAAGFVDSIAGGGGLLSVPVLLSVGLSPTQAIATNKLQSSFGSISATWVFWRSGQLDLKSMRLAILCTFAGAAAGAVAVQRIDPGFLEDVLPVLLVAIALYFLLSPRLGDADARQRIDLPLFSVTVGFALGFYDGFFGPGAGSFFAAAFVALLGYNLRKATAHTKLLNVTSNVASLLLFIAGGQVVWAVGFAMAIGQVLGGRLGSTLVVARGARLVRPLLVVMSVAITIKLLADGDGEATRFMAERLATFLPAW